MSFYFYRINFCIFVENSKVRVLFNVPNFSIGFSDYQERKDFNEIQTADVSILVIIWGFKTFHLPVEHDVTFWILNL